MLTCAAVMAQDRDEPAEDPGTEARAPEAVERDLRDVEGRIEALEGELRELQEQRLRLQGVIGDEDVELGREDALELIVGESEERLDDAVVELEELEQMDEEDLEDTAAWREWRRRRMAYLRRVAALERRIQALDDADQLDRAQELLLELQQLETRWWMVEEPRLSRAVELEEMENAALQYDDPRLFRMVRRLREVYEEDVDRAEQLYGLWLERSEQQLTMDATARQFWSRASVLRRHMEQDEEGEDIDLEERAEDPFGHNEDLIEEMDDDIPERDLEDNVEDEDEEEMEG
jgi:hypothetical protein